MTFSHFSQRALYTRLNACWFQGRIYAPQRKCLTIFSTIWLYHTRVYGQDIPVSWLSYMLATIYHETATTMQPIAEYGRGKGRPYGETDPETGQIYYGRGYVQLTWKENYVRAQQVVINPDTLERDVPLVAHPDLAMRPFYASQIAVSGMVNGWFTGRKFSDYLTADETDYISARRIINGKDRAETIAGYAQEAEEAVRLALGEGIRRSLVLNGSQGDDVRELQLMLGLDADGIAGKKTEAAILAFQSEAGLRADGLCGEDTWAELDRKIYGC